MFCICEFEPLTDTCKYCGMARTRWCARINQTGIEGERAVKTITKTDLEDLTLLLEDLVKRLPDMKREERIDVAARVRTAAKQLKTIDEVVKEEIKKSRKGKEGYVLGGDWKAKLTLVPVQRLDQKLFKEEQPEMAKRYTNDCEDQRITWEPR